MSEKLNLFPQEGPPDEDAMEQLLLDADVPDELRERVLERALDPSISPEAGMKMVEEFLIKRRQSLDLEPSPTINSGIPSQELAEGMRALESPTLTAFALEAFTRPDNVHLGDGKAATVVTIPEYPDWCFKVITNPQEYAQTNTVVEEGYFLSRLDHFEVDGVRAPHLYSLVRTEKVLAIGMERIHGISIEEAIQDPSRLPPGFDIGRFFTQLKAYYARMHSEFSFYHRDMHPGNVMVTVREGEVVPVPIDFGRARLAPLGEHAYAYYEGSKLKELETDEFHIERMKKNLQTAIDTISKAA